LTNFPRAIYAAVGEYTINGGPMICGGISYNNDCFAYEDGAWNSFSSMTSPRAHAAASLSPYQNRNHSLFVTGGFNTEFSFLHTAEILSEGEWQKSPTSLPVTIYRHCMVVINSTTVMVIGGIQNGFTVPSPNTFYFNTENEMWVAGPKLLAGRQLHSCGKLQKESGSSQTSIVVVGGLRGAYLSSVEILDDGASEWRTGANLPIGIDGASMIEDPAGGVILIGGYNDGTYMNTLYQLPNANSEWILMPQMLKIARHHATAFLVPDEITSCS
jgi:hypothetical protein